MFGRRFSKKRYTACSRVQRDITSEGFLCRFNGTAGTMKLIRWVEIHIGRSRKKSKKAPTESQNPTTAATLVAATPDLGGVSKEEHQYEEVRFDTVRSPRTPKPAEECLGKVPAHIRTSFLDQVSPADVSSPRQRSRIKTNPWLPSPRSPCGSTSADSGWTGSRSSTGSENSEPGDAGSDASSYHHWTSMSSLRNSRETIPSPWASLKPRTPSFVPDSYRRPLPHPPFPPGGAFPFRRRPESARVYRRDFASHRKGVITHISDGSCSSDDEAYSEDFVQSEDSDVATVKGQKTLASPQTDSACDSAGSCTTTPVSEVNCCTRLQKESLGEKVRRLRAERVVVEEKMREARVEEQVCREERILLHREMLQFRRLLLLKTLQGLRVDLENQSQGRRMCTTTVHTRAEWRVERRNV